MAARAPADPTKVVFFLDGGATCFDATTCAFVAESYDWKVNDDPASEGGILDFARADNPFGDDSFLYVPSCTGDTHLGDVTRECTPELTVEHNGYVNGTAALSYLAAHYPDASQVVVVVGKTNGSIAAPVYGGLSADLLLDAHVIVFGGQSGHIPDDPDGNAWSRWDRSTTWPWLGSYSVGIEWWPRRPRGSRLTVRTGRCSSTSPTLDISAN